MQSLTKVVGGVALTIVFAFLLVTRPGGWLGWAVGGALLVTWIVWIIDVVEGTRGFSREFRRGWREKA